VKRFSALGVACVLLILSQQAHAGIGISVKVSTMGFGIDITKSLKPMLNARAGLHYLPGGNYSERDGSVSYDKETKVRVLGLFVDLHPNPLNSLRFTGGLLYNGYEEEWVSQPAQSYKIGYQVYTADEVGKLNGRLDFMRLAPYFGVGWGNAAQSRRRISFAADLGIAYIGSPKVNLTATGPIASQPRFVDDLRREADDRTESEDEHWWKNYPVVSLGISVRLSDL